MATSRLRRAAVERGADKVSDMASHEDSSESEAETEPAKAFHRRISTNRSIKTTKSIKEGYLLKQTSSFQRYRRRYFKLKGRKLYYAKDTKSVIFDEIELIEVSVAECSTKNVNHSFQVITPFRNLVLCADSRKEMEEWIMALKSAASREFYEPNTDHREVLSGQHNWYACSHARPTYCNVCKEALSGVTSHGLSCEVCKFKAHKRCAVRANNNCKWTTLAAIGKDIIEEEDGSISMPHQWLAGNLPVSAKCVVCEKTCGSVLRLQDWRCLWCRATVHSSCQESYHRKCPLGPCRVSIMPPTAITNLDSDGFWRATRHPGTSPLLVFVNSKSGDNQGVKIMRRFKQLLNPAQVFDLIGSGPKIGLRLFQSFESFRVLVCGGDGSIGWVLNEIDQLGLHKQCQIGVLPLGTGNDLARVLGWGAAFDDDAQLPGVLEQMEHAQINMLDRWGIMIYEGNMAHRKPQQVQFDMVSAYEDSVAPHLANILGSDSHNTVISSAKVLCETVKDFLAKVAEGCKDEATAEGGMSNKCAVLNQKLDALLTTLRDESQSLPTPSESHTEVKADIPDSTPIVVSVEVEQEDDVDDMALEPIIGSPTDHDAMPEPLVTRRRPRKAAVYKPRDQLMSRANSLKKAIRQIIEHTEKAVDEQNGLHLDQSTSTCRSPLAEEPEKGRHSPTKEEKEQQNNGVRESLGATALEPAPSPKRPTLPNIQILVPDDLDDDMVLSTPEVSPVMLSPLTTIASLMPGSTMASLSVPSLSMYHSDGDSSACSTPGSLSPVPGNSPVMKRRDSSAPPLSPEPGGSRRLSFMSTLNKSMFSLKREKSPTRESSFPLLGPSLIPLLSDASSGIAGGLAGGSFISKVLLANADALCAAATPLMAQDVDLDEYKERCVMNNYFGIGLDAKISLDFNTKREEHPEKCRSRTKNLMWYGVIGGKELMYKSFKKLEQRVQLECDGQRIPLPNLQGIVVLNIPSYMGGTNFWGGKKENDCFTAPSFDDKILEVVAVFGSVQLGLSRVVNLQRHRIAQCRSVKITIMGEEGVPVQVDGEAWVQPPGLIRIVHKNRAQMLTRDKVFEEALKTWTEKQKIEKPVSTRHHSLSDEEAAILTSFVEATEMLIKSVKVASIYHSSVEQELSLLATQSSGFLDRLYPEGKLSELEADPSQLNFQPAIRTQVSDLVSSVRTLYNEALVFMSEKAASIHLPADVEEKLMSALSAMEVEMKKVYEIGGLPHFQAIQEEVSQLKMKHKEKSRFRLVNKLRKGGRKDKEKEAKYTGPSVYSVYDWGLEEVCLWLESLSLGEYRDKFVSHDVTGPELLSLGRTDLKDLGISKVGHLKRIQQGIKDIKERLSAHEKSSTTL